ncbi:MipA/OmpV family protein [Aquabacterium humicola]|uniref:MipA/OmpV family protein n=1 Tax=Aquabacterium humicola TaxID=3237377 RepID=UPI002542C697|nr:MipA/OmpV family protein [Rubrivivax pictus]
MDHALANRRLAAAGLFVALGLLPGARAVAQALGNASESRWLLGAAMVGTPEYPGSDRQVLKTRPLLAARFGRWRFSTGGAGALLDFGGAAAGPGASAELIETDRLRLGLSLRVDSGRRAASSDYLRGLPDVERTLRGRLYAAYKLGTQWSAGASVSQDLLGRDGGAVASLGLGYTLRLSPRTELSAGAGVDFGDARHLRSYYGITPQQSAAVGLPSFMPGAGGKDVHAGGVFTTALDADWVMFVGGGSSRLIGDAALSPLARSTRAWGLSAGLAFRCCR